MKPLTAPTRNSIRLPPVRPNAGIQAAYQKRLDAMIAQMARSVSRAVLATYRARPPEITMDESPAAALQATINRMAREWGKKFDDFAKTIGRKFAKDATGSADRSFMAQLKKIGFAVDFKMTPAAQDILTATIAEQVQLIKSIPQQYLVQVQGSVMRSATAGRDMSTLARELEQHYGVTKRRAAFISRDQNNKATSAIVRARQAELGITKAVWVHSAGGKKPRPEHVKFDGHEYDVAKGAFLEGKWTFPGYEVNCRCVSRAVIPGLD